MSASVESTGPERFCNDVIEGEFRYRDKNGSDVCVYKPYAKQNAFHNSQKKHRLLGGAAGPGKTLALICDHMMGCYDFSDPQEAKQVHTLLLRRTHPKLEATVLTRFREQIPKELYRSFNESKKQVTWLNGAMSHFGSMQHEHDAYGWQGQWYKIGYDELAEFTFKQWQATSAWNRCPVSPFVTKDGASNPIGPGAGWVKSLFIDKTPCEEMDENQRAQYNADDYEYFPCTYLDNPVYANDPIFLANLENYNAAERDALKFAIWGVAGGYFSGAWDPAENVYEDEEFEIKPWHKRWLGGDWGHSHWAANYALTMDDFGIIRVYKEAVTNDLSPKELAEYIAREMYDPDGSMPVFQRFMYSHDAWHQKYDRNTIAVQMNSTFDNYKRTEIENGVVVERRWIPVLTNAGTDKIGREQLMFDLLKSRVQIGEIMDRETGMMIPVKVAGLQIARSCQRLIKAIPLAPMDESSVVNEEKIAQFPGLDMIDGCDHGLYGSDKRPAEKPESVRLQERLTPLPVEGTARFIAHMDFKKKEREQNPGVYYLGGLRNRRRRH